MNSPEKNSLPTLFLVCDLEKSDQLRFVEELCSACKNQAEIVFSTPNQPEVPQSFGRYIDRSSNEFLSGQIFSDVFVILDRFANLYRYNDRQKVFSLLSFEEFTQKGVPIATPIKSRISDKDFEYRQAVHNYIFDAPNEEEYSIYGVTNSFFSESNLMELSNRVLPQISKTFKRRKNGGTDLLVFLRNASTVKFLTDEFVQFVQNLVDEGTNKIVVFSDCDAQILSRLPRTAHIKFSAVRGGLGEIDISPQTIVCFDELQMVRQAGLLKAEHTYLDFNNLQLLPKGREISLKMIEDLCDDPALVYRKVLDEAYRDFAVSSKSVAIIVPHYNTDLKKLTRCLLSAFACREFHANTEIMLIDDGSAEDITPQLKTELGAQFDDIIFYRKTNSGLGPTRNFGVEKTQADYVYFLDSDDEIVAENLKYMLAQAEHLSCDMVVGKRILCDAEGSFLSDSLDYTFQGISRLATAENLEIFDDQMANNKLIKRSVFFDNSLWFNPGLYEDNAFTSQLYNVLPKLCFLNFTIHKWYQYGEGESITKTISKRHIFEKISSLEDAWTHLNDEQRLRRIGYNLSNDMRHYVRAAACLAQDERIEIADHAKQYIERRKNYVRKPNHAAAMTELLEVIDRLPVNVLPKSSLGEANQESRHVFFARTHFHFLSALVHTLEFKYTSILVLDETSPAFSPRFVQILRKLNLFSEILTYRSDVIFMAFSHIIKLGSAAPPVVFDTLFREFRTKLPGLRNTDVGVFFLDHLPDSYFAGRFFGRLKKFEDGYHSINRELVLDTDNGVWGQISILCKENYDTLHTKKRNLTEIVVSNEVDQSLLNDEYSAVEIVKLDFKELANRHSEVLSASMKKLYGTVKKLDYDTTIVITQPLYHNFCSVEEHLALVAYMASLATTKNVVIKPHPSDACNYAPLGLPVIGSGVPFEYFEASNQQVKSAITFGSSALVGSKSVEDVRYLFKLEGFVIDDVRNAIQVICYDHQAIELEGTKALVAKNSKVTVPRPRQAAKFAFSKRTIVIALKLLVSDWPHFKRRLIDRIKP